MIFRGNFRSGATRSCGCLLQESRGAETHGASGSRLYRAYSALIQRCTNPNSRLYKNYGGRGITISQDWLESFEAFRAHTGEPPSGKYSLDRIDNNGNYEPGNVRWATAREQARNTRRNVWLKHNGRRMLATDWARELGISRQRLEQRIRAGLPPERLFASADECAQRMRGRRCVSPVLVLNGRSQTATEWARELGISRDTITNRLKAQLPIEQVLSQGRVRTTKPRKARAMAPYRCSACNERGHNRATCNVAMQKAS